MASRQARRPRCGSPGLPITVPSRWAVADRSLDDVHAGVACLGGSGGAPSPNASPKKEKRENGGGVRSRRSSACPPGSAAACPHRAARRGPGVGARRARRARRRLRKLVARRRLLARRGPGRPGRVREELAERLGAAPVGGRRPPPGSSRWGEGVPSDEPAALVAADHGEPVHVAAPVAPNLARGVRARRLGTGPEAVLRLRRPSALPAAHALAPVGRAASIGWEAAARARRLAADRHPGPRPRRACPLPGRRLTRSFEKRARVTGGDVEPPRREHPHVAAPADRAAGPGWASRARPWVPHPGSSVAAS